MMHIVNGGIFLEPNEITELAAKLFRPGEEKEASDWISDIISKMHQRRVDYLAIMESKLKTMESYLEAANTEITALQAVVENQKKEIEHLRDEKAKAIKAKEDLQGAHMALANELDCLQPKIRGINAQDAEIKRLQAALNKLEDDLINERNKHFVFTESIQHLLKRDKE